eukprot:5133606-Pleurochrysis_carterae.AAC.1
MCIRFCARYRIFLCVLNPSLLGKQYAEQAALRTLPAVELAAGCSSCWNGLGTVKTLKLKSPRC